MLKIMFKSALMLIIGASVLMSFTTVSFNRWKLLGAKKVDYGLDRDEIITTFDGPLTALRFKVKRSPINMHKIMIYFRNGDVEEIIVRENLGAGGQSRIIDLPGNKRSVNKVVFLYDTKNLARRKGVVELWGRR